MGLTSARKLAPRAAGPPLGQMQMSFSQQDPADVARETNRHLAVRGWCVWKCSAFDGEAVVVVDPCVSQGVPTGYCTYTLPELYALARLDPTTIRLVHEAKRVAGATIVSVEVLE